MCITVELVPEHYNVQAAYTIPTAWVGRVWDGDEMVYQARALTRDEALRLMHVQYPDAKEE